MYKLNFQAVKDNLQHIAGIIVGYTICKHFNLRFNKEHRGTFKLFSHVAANLAADGVVQWLPYNMIYRSK